MPPSIELQIRDFESSGHRHYRGRNHLADEVVRRPEARAPTDPPFWDDLFTGSVRMGLDAARKTFKMALSVWGLMMVIALCYYFVPASHIVFSRLIDIQDRMGFLFPSLGMGLSVGLLVETVKVLLSSDRRWTRANTTNALFNFLVFGLMGLTSYYRYPLQDEWFGSGNSWTVLMSKVAFDQFVWTVFLANPYQAIAYLWKNSGYSWRSVGRRVFPLRTFWGTQMLPVLIANWAFWIPMAFLVYSFPLEIQLPISILAVTIWVLLLSVLAASTAKDED